MGNTPSSRARVHVELERFVKPVGLYPSCQWDERLVRKLVLDGNIAPRFCGMGKKYKGVEECPICMLFYAAVNRTVCCKKPICTECYLQVRAPRGSSCCPYCNKDQFMASYNLCIEDEERLMDKELDIICLHDKIVESEENGEAAVPIVEHTPGDEVDVDVDNAEAVYRNVPLASVQDRRSIEDEVRKLLKAEQQRGLVDGLRGMRLLRRGGSGRRISERSHRDSDVRRMFFESLGLGMPRNTQTMEDLMVMEAMRQSIEDIAPRAEHGAAQQVPQGAPQASRGVSRQLRAFNMSGLMGGLPLSDDAQLELAMSLSLQQAQQEEVKRSKASSASKEQPQVAKEGGGAAAGGSQSTPPRRGKMSPDGSRSGDESGDDTILLSRSITTSTISSTMTTSHNNSDNNLSSMGEETKAEPFAASDREVDIIQSRGRRW